MKGRLLVVNTSGHSAGRVVRTIGNELLNLGWEMSFYDMEESVLTKWYTILRSFRPSVQQWKQSRRLVSNQLARTRWMFDYRTRICAKEIRKQASNADIVLQAGAWCFPFWRSPRMPYTIICDCTVKLGEIDSHSLVHFSSATAANQWYAREASVYRNASFVFPYSQFVKRSLVQDYGVPETRVVPIGSAPNVKAPIVIKREYGRNIVFVGYEFERKGGLVLLDAFRKVRQVLPDAELWIAGPPRLNHDLPEGARLFGTLNSSELSDLYQRASLFVMPCLFEPFGIAFLEAMEHQLPCIGSDRCAIPEIISHGETGYVTPVGDSETLARYIIELLQRPDLMREMGARGRAKAQRAFTWPTVARTIDEKLVSAIQSPRMR